MSSPGGSQSPCRTGKRIRYRPSDAVSDVVDEALKPAGASATPVFDVVECTSFGGGPIEQAGNAGEVADDVVNLNIHLGECLVQVPHMIGRVADEVAAVTKQRANGADLFAWTEAGTEMPWRRRLP